ncbi:hypothetical protein [Streptomyces yangpuensis]|uniref:hypothetical protein n=1 Tax=Streptomyces yangpuensis TaxID=1648182 RepID=UPI003649CF59
MARLASTVYVRDPETHQWVTCDAGTEPEQRLAALILTPSAWEEGRPPEAGPDTAPAAPAAVGESPDRHETTAPEAAAEPDPEKKPRTPRRTTPKADE